MMALFLLLVGCGEQEDTATCSQDVTTCEGQVLLQCDGGAWVELADCEIMGTTCVEGEPSCQ